MKHYIAVLTAALMANGVFAQQANQVTVGDNMNFGITYSLPKTGLQITLSATCTKTVAGQYAVYAEKFLGLNDVALSDRTSYSLDGISMETVALPDPKHTYHIEFSEKGALPTFYLTDDRCLWAINQAPVAPAQVAAPAAAEAGKKANPYKPSDVLNLEILKASSKAKQAELIAQEILSIRESRSELIRGEADNVPNDGKQLQLMLDNLTAQEEALLTYFVGTTTTTPLSHTFIYMPAAETESEVAFRFSSELGFVEADDLAGAPYYVSVAVTEDNRMPAVTDPKALKKLEKGIAFCVPGKARVRLSTAYKVIAEGDFQLAQFGHVEQLPQDQFTDKKKPCSAVFTPTTGAIKIFQQ